MSKRKCCGTCANHLPLPLDEWVCDNEESEYYGLETEYKDSCDEYEPMGGRDD